MKTLMKIFTVLVLFAGLTHAQNRTRFGGEYAAIDYAYGVIPQVPALAIQTGNASTGSATITVQYACVPLGDGTNLCPLATNAPITIGTGAGGTLETITPSGTSNCTQGSAYGSCSITATFTYAHGTGEPITSGSVGLQEAINAANGSGGGSVVVQSAWTRYGGTTTLMTAAAVSSKVFLVDNRGIGTSTYWSTQPSTLTVLAAPTTLTATNIVFTSATGTWAASSTHFIATCVDVLGGESAGSADYTQTPTLNYTLTVVAPTCATGAVGWRLYAGTSSAAIAYLLPVSSSSCTLTTLETVFPACALGATGTWAATFTTTTNLVPVALGVTNTNNPVPQGHTTFAYAPTGSLPVTFQSNYGPFGSGTIASATASANTILGSFNLPAGYLNTIGRTVRVTGKIKMTAGASSTLGIGIGAVWAGGVTAGAPVVFCNPTSGFVFATAAAVVDFSCTMTTNAVGATAVGSIQPEGWFLGNTAAGTGTTSPQGLDVSASAVGSLGLFSQLEFSVYLQPLVAADTTVQLMSLHVETLQ